MPKVRIGQVGITGHGATILNAVRSAKSLELAAIFDTRFDEAKKVSNELGIQQAKDYDDLLRDRDIQAVALVTPNHLHADQVEKAVRAGKHIFVEKPMARTVAEAKQMISRAKNAGLVLMVGHNMRRHPVFRRAKNILENNVIGKTVGVEMNVSRSAGLFPDVPMWKADPNITPLLPMTQLGIHFVELLHYLLNSATEYVSCVAANIEMKGGALDSTAALLQLESGIPVTLSSYYVTPDVFEVRVFGTQGILHCSIPFLRVDLLRNGALKRELQEDFSPDGQPSFVEEMNEFGECVLMGRKPETGGEEGLRALAVIEAMAESLKTRTVVHMDNILRGS